MKMLDIPETPATVGALLAARIGADNAHALESLAAAYRAALDLSEHGCQIVSIMTGWRNPVIMLGEAPPVGYLEGALHTSRLGAHGVTRVYATHHLGAQVEWRAR
jgi:hypothetical protein